MVQLYSTKKKIINRKTKQTKQKQKKQKTTKNKQKSVIGGVSITEEMSFLFMLEICFHCNTPKQDGFGVGFSPEKYISEMFI